MKLSVNAVAFTMGLLWASSMLLVGIVNLAHPGYGADFLRMMSSVYPGFHDAHTWGKRRDRNSLWLRGRPCRRMDLRMDL